MGLGEVSEWLHPDVRFGVQISTPADGAYPLLAVSVIWGSFLCVSLKSGLLSGILSWFLGSCYVTIKPKTSILFPHRSLNSLVIKALPFGVYI